MTERKIVASVEKGHAIDHTPIYTIKVHRSIPAGAILEFDVAESVIEMMRKEWSA